MTSGCLGVMLTVRWYSDPVAAGRLNTARPFSESGFWLREADFDASDLGRAVEARPFVWWVDAAYTYLQERP